MVDYTVFQQDNGDNLMYKGINHLTDLDLLPNRVVSFLRIKL